MSLAKVAAASAVSGLVVAAIFVWLFRKLRLRQASNGNGSFRREEMETTDNEFEKLGKNVKGLIVEEGGRDVLYLRKLEDGGCRDQLPKMVSNPSYQMNDEEEKRAHGLTEMRLRASHEAVLPLKEQAKSNLQKPVPPPPPLPPLPPCQAARISPRVADLAKKVPDSQLNPVPTTPPPPPPALQPLISSVPIRKMSFSPVPPPLPTHRTQVSSSHLKPVPATRGKQCSRTTSDLTDVKARSNDDGPTKLKPLHWDKITTNADHSVVWDEISDGSLYFDDQLMETLFGYKNTDRQSPAGAGSSSSSSNNNNLRAPTSQVFILEPRRSQNSAIVLKSLGVSRTEILDTLLMGQGLNSDTLEKLDKMAPTHEEATRILQFNGNPNKLTDAEAFLYHILKAVPSAFICFKAMLFRLNYDGDILHLKESLQTIELGCKELRTRGLFMKLLAAILKAGNRMNAGTSRGNAQGFNLSTLGKLADVKSTDGKTTLLHFVVEQVVRSEGRRCSNSRNSSSGRTIGTNNLTEEGSQKEFLFLGLQQLGSLSNDLSNVKKAATIEYASFINMCSNLSGCVAKTHQILASCDSNDQGTFLRGMKEFLEGCDGELNVVREKQARVMELVKRTTDYYQVGASKDKGMHPLQLFVLVKDFLNMVDRARVDITQKLQKKVATANMGLSPPQSPSARSPPRFTGYSLGLGKGTAGMGSSSDSEDDFR